MLRTTSWQLDKRFILSIAKGSPFREENAHRPLYLAQPYANCTEVFRKPAVLLGACGDYQTWALYAAISLLTRAYHLPLMSYQGEPLEGVKHPVQKVGSGRGTQYETALAPI